MTNYFGKTRRKYLSRYFFFQFDIKKIKLNHLHAVSRTQQGRQREPSVKTLRHFLPNSGGIAC